MDAEQQNIELTEKQEAFCQNYLIDFNGSRAAIAAGYSSESSAQEASRLLTKVNIQARINALRVEMGKGFNITRERIAQEYARIAFFDIRKIHDEDDALKPVKEFSDDEAAAIAGIETEDIWDRDVEGNRIKIGRLRKVKVTDKRGALDSLAKLMGYNAPDKTAMVDDQGNAVQPIININVIRTKKEIDDSL
jgi:phage terminase small subunit